MESVVSGVLRPCNSVEFTDGSVACAASIFSI